MGGGISTLSRPKMRHGQSYRPTTQLYNRMLITLPTASPRRSIFLEFCTLNTHTSSFIQAHLVATCVNNDTQSWSCVINMPKIALEMPKCRQSFHSMYDSKWCPMALLLRDNFGVLPLILCNESDLLKTTNLLTWLPREMLRGCGAWRSIQFR